MAYSPKNVIYTTSKPGKPASQDFYGLLKEAKIPIKPAQSTEQVAKESDVLFVCCALSEETKNLVNAEFLAKMKSTAVIVNTARGPIIDSDALATALKKEKLLGAGLDVLTNEPNIGADHPLGEFAFIGWIGSDHSLVTEPRAIVLPHIGSATVETRGLMAEEAVKNVLAALEGTEMVNEKSL